MISRSNSSAARIPTISRRCRPAAISPTPIPHTCPARVPQPRGAAPPGRPPGTKNRHPAPRYDAGKTVKRPETLKAIGRAGRSWQMKNKLNSAAA
ncbi:hypothetical protein GCM10023336_37150 [Streptomyces similanensis]|uniref:Uncharacterized protein n=1 Tax=Streptomyces similanensis TaxID=1274988 RepID=A0ABP9KMS1_9ACTN